MFTSLIAIGTGGGQFHQGTISLLCQLEYIRSADTSIDFGSGRRNCTIRGEILLVVEDFCLFDRLRRFERENGIYVFGTGLVEHCIGLVRNYLISKKLGVQTIRLGPRSYLRGLSSIQMGEDFSAGPGLWLEAIARYKDQTFSPKIVIGDRVQISHYVHIAATHLVEIGDDVLIGSKVIITDHNHGQYSGDVHTSPHIGPTSRPLDRDRRVVIGRNVWLGDAVVVTPGSSIGEGAVIGANSVVIGNIPPFAIAVGTPATVRKTFNMGTGKWCDIK